MINLLVGALPGLVAALVVWLAASGVRMYRYDPLDDVHPDELVDASELVGSSGGENRRILVRLGRRFVPVLRQVLPLQVIRRLQRQIDLAGRPAGVDVDSVLAQQAGLIIIAVPLALLYSQSGQSVMVVLLLVLVLLWPTMRLVTAARKRREQVDRDLPDFLDVLAVTVSAGISFRSALATVSNRFGGPLGQEVTTSLHQISNGASLRSAFKNLRSRTGSQAVDEFVTAYLQAEELGAPLVDSLNQIADDMRRSAAQRALQRAAGVAPRITLVTTLVMVPATLILVVVGLIVGSNVDLGAVLGG